MDDDECEWDEAKNVTSHAKHGVWFERARLAFSDTCAIGTYDDRDVYGEDRFTLTGMADGHLLFVVYVERIVDGGGGSRDRIRIISARRTTKYEQNDYFQQNSQGM